MTWSLLRKELWQHWIAFSAAALLSIACGAALLATATVRGQAGTPFEGYRLFAAVFGVILAIVVCHRLVVLEYQGRTQLFLEGLPVSRWRMLALKYVLGLGFTLGLLSIGFAICAVVALRHDPPSPRFLAIAGMRAGSYAWCAYSFFFVMGLLGRYRAAVYIAMVFVLLGLQEMSSVQFSRFGPFALMDNTFAYEADQFPWEALRNTWLLGACMVGLAAVLGLVREGSVAALLSEKMSHREKVFVSALLVGLLWTVTLVSEKAKRVAFDLPNAVVQTAPGVAVKVAPDPGEDTREPAESLAREVASHMGKLAEYLGAEALPPVFITSREDLDAGRYERGELEHHHGVHIQANFHSPEWQMADFLPWVIREVLIVASNDRAKHESRRFVLDGFGLYWCRREQVGENDRRIALRALYGVRDGFELEDFSHWLSFRERVGDPIASAVACSALETLSGLCEPGQFREFVRATLALRTPKDLRAVLGKGGEEWDRALEARAKVAPHRFYQAWQKQLRQAAAQHGENPAHLPTVEASLSVSRLPGSSRGVAYSLAVEPVPADTNAVVSLLYRVLPPYDEEVEEASLIREQNTLAAAGSRELPGGYSRHQRLYWTGAYKAPELGCEVISGWKRTELK